MNLVDLMKQRVSLLHEVTGLSESKCTGCEIRSSANGISACQGCSVLNEFKMIGGKLTVNLSLIRKLRSAPIQPKAKVLAKPPKKLKKVESVCVKMVQIITVEMYQDFKAQGMTDKAIREKVGLDNNKFYKFKQDNELIVKPGKNAEKERITPTLRNEVINIPSVELERVTILEDELTNFKSQLSDAMSFIESLKVENAALNEQLWGSRLQALYAKQAELENFIAEKHGLDVLEYLEEQQLATLVELAESANEWQGFKYWKQNKVVDREKLLEETVDVLHLILARGITFKWKVTSVEPLIKPSITQQYKTLMYVIGTDEESQVTYFLAFNLYVGLVEMLGFTWLEVEAAYAKKHQENIDRQNNDY